MKIMYKKKYLESVNHYHEMNLFEDKNGKKNYLEILIIELKDGRFFISNINEKYRGFKTIHQDKYPEDIMKLSNDTILFNELKVVKRYIQEEIFQN